ncbi:hypothetical protein BJF79_47695 [Actinomadura sp. CNU-125]|uniref:RICIN domain-containing protein n=1 Tax=Actinomadura sp. CNU-125 TaxID=1904961 RepID=UPI000968D75A|nr:RICIN domain-containing protein [Actinomadura sp. CNU-125]OLT19605.1 hypothetical protein BJF79_47695 [Actinomadura sp. CNU-125]
MSVANAFDRRAWQRGEKPKVQTRLLAGGVALVVVAATVFGVGALISYQQGREEDERKKRAALNQPANPVAVSPSPSPSSSASSPSPSRSPRGGTERAPAAVPKRTTSGPKTVKRATGSRFPTGPNFSTTTKVLLHNVMTGLCADVPGFGKGKVDGPVEQFACDGSAKDNQRWDLVVNQKGAGPDGADLFTIRNAKDGLCMDLPGYGPPAKTAKVTEWRCNPGGGDNQMWYLDRKKPGRFWIRNQSSGGLCLDVAGVNGAGGPAADLTVYPCAMTGDHLWSFS